jgi:hypothetical protein
MADSLGIDPDAVLGKLVRIWVWADQQTIDGNAGSVTLSLLDRLSGVTGFAKAMLRAGWLKQVDNGVQFVNFDRHNGETAKKRALTARRVDKHRASNATKPQTGAGCNAVSVTDTLPEERREEKNTVVTPESARPLHGTPETQEPQQPQSPEAPPATLPATIPRRPSFRKPSVQDVAEYATGICLEIDPQAFHDYYAANGWRIGRNAMKDWKAAARSWAKRDRDYASERHAGISRSAAFQRETPFERNQRNEQQQLQLLADMCTLAEEQNARHAAEQQARDAGSSFLGHADPGAYHR